jgi:hypothetical protein
MGQCLSFAKPIVEEVAQAAAETLKESLQAGNATLLQQRQEQEQAHLLLRLLQTKAGPSMHRFLMMQNSVLFATCMMETP